MDWVKDSANRFTLYEGDQAVAVCCRDGVFAKKWRVEAIDNGRLRPLGEVRQKYGVIPLGSAESLVFAALAK